MKDSRFSRELLAMTAKSSKNNSNKWLPFWMHCYDTAGILKKLYSRWVPVATISAMGNISEEELEKIILFLGMVHDIGKLTILFQSRLATCIDGQWERLDEAGIQVKKINEFIYGSKTPHSLAGEAILLDAGCPLGIATVVGAHHGKPLNTTDDPLRNLQYYKSNYCGTDESIWRNLWNEWIDNSLKYAGIQSIKDLPEINMASQLLLSALLIISDWISSNSLYFPLIWEDECFDMRNYPERIKNGWERLRFPERWMPQSYQMDGEDFEVQFGFIPNAIQKAVLDIIAESEIPGLVIIEAQMGQGKTEAALAMSEVLASRRGNGGVYFGLPSQATANGLFPRIKRWAEEQAIEEVHSIELLHGAAILNEEFQYLTEHIENIGEDLPSEGVFIHQWFEGKKTGLLSDFAIGTVDQILMAALKKKHFMLRMFGLVGKVVIVDECHSYDAYMNYYLERVLNWLGGYGTSVILLSATLPSCRRQDLVRAYIYGKNRRLSKKVNVEGKGYPLITWTENAEVRQMKIQVFQEKKKIRISRIIEKAIPEDLRQRLSLGGCAGVIVNTVCSAQLLSQKLQAELPDYKVILYHSRFIMADRVDIEKEILRRVGKLSSKEERDKTIIVGTQVLEQSLDIDFDVLFTQLCPMDLLLQRIGRLHRHKRNRPKRVSHAECIVVAEEESPYDQGSEAIYGKWLLYRTWKFLKNEICLPDDIPVLVENVYDENFEEILTADEKAIFLDYRNSQKQKRIRAEQFCIPTPSNSRSPIINSIEGMLDTSINDKSDAEATVRDGDGSIEVIIMKNNNNGTISYVPWQNQGQKLLAEYMPCREDVKKISMQKVRLPRIFNYNWNDVIDELKSVTQTNLPEWIKSPTLKGELFLLLDENNEALLAGKRILYTKQEGLMIKEEGA